MKVKIFETREKIQNIVYLVIRGHVFAENSFLLIFGQGGAKKAFSIVFTDC